MNLDICGTAYLPPLCQCLCVCFQRCMNACVCYLASYSVVHLHGLRLPSNTGLYDRAGPGASGHPSLPRGVLHGGSRPASPPTQRSDLTEVAVEILVVVGPPKVQDGRGRARARTRAGALAMYRGPLCARVGHGRARLSYTAVCLAGNLLTQL